MEPINILIIVIVFFIASFFGSLTGGGGLITIPTLIFMGLSPITALGTGKIGAVGITSGSAIGYGMKKKIDYKMGFIFMIFAVIGSIFGTLTILSIPEELIKNFIGIIMIIIVFFLFLNPDIGTKTKKVNRSILLISLFALGSGFFSGFYGPGIGTINRLVLAAFFSYTIINSAALSTFANSVTNLFSLLIFSIYGVVQFSLFIPIFAAAFIGGYLGSRYAMKLGNVNVKRLLLTVAIIMAIKLLFF
tara:strand:- start:681 stop:1421 length:741 start_codon:yes stop_codon:yes gene_type:complete